MKLPFARCFALLSLLFSAASVFAQSTFSNPTSIQIVDNAPANPYPSNIVVSGLGPTVTKVTVTLNLFNHPFPDDVGVLLVGPTGVAVRLMTDAGGGPGLITNFNVSFDDAAPTMVPDEGPLAPGTFQPTEGTISTASNPHPASFPAPAPASPYSNLLASFNGTDPNGTWRLFINDDTMIDGGSIDGGWSITITAIPEPSTWLLLGVGLIGMVALGYTRRRRCVA